MGLAWVINLAVAEYVIHRRAQASARERRPSGRIVRTAASDLARG
jgi:hypothetical protein